MNIVTDAVIAEGAQQEETIEAYSCNTCKVSFSSVIEHIQNYHTDQEVVVEVLRIAYLILDDTKL